MYKLLDKTWWTIRSWTRPPGLYAPGQGLVDYTLLDKAWWTIRSWTRPGGLYAPEQDPLDYTLLDRTPWPGPGAWAHSRTCPFKNLPMKELAHGQEFAHSNLAVVG